MDEPLGSTTVILMKLAPLYREIILQRWKNLKEQKMEKIRSEPKIALFMLSVESLLRLLSGYAPVTFAQQVYVIKPLGVQNDRP